MEQFIAHSEPYRGGPKHLLRDHLASVRELASGFGDPLHLAREADLCGLLHDLGKYGELFQRRLQGLERGIDHWSVGAHTALLRFRSPECALVIQGHHIGLQSGSGLSLQQLCQLRPFPDGLRLSAEGTEPLLQSARADGFVISESVEATRAPELAADQMCKTRMLFSCLVDADFIDTEAHFLREPGGQKIHRPEGARLEVNRAIEALDRYMANLGHGEASAVNRMRQRVQEDCVEAAGLESGTFTLTAPTGYGKTLSMLRFALLHAQKHGLRRLVVVLPFLNLIEETAKIYRQAFEGFPLDYVLEDHSLANDPEDNGDEQGRNLKKMLAENWDAPIVITTNVRLLESLHANRPGACRKLHRLSRSVILMDEVQTLTTNLVVATLATLSSVGTRFGSTVVFATATQPAFDDLDDPVAKFTVGGWKPREIVTNVDELYRQSERVMVDWRTHPQSWEEIADELASQEHAMIIVNLRKHASRFTALLMERCRDDHPCHLSTNMVVEHRRQVLKSIREKPSRVVATQCVEAGVDLDFPCVFRAWAPLDSIAQAAGRCNRHGKKELGRFVVFTPEDEGFPDGGYRQATQVARNLVQTCEVPVLHDPDLFRKFYRQLYRFRGVGQEQGTDEREILEAMRAQNYKDVAQLYRLIPNAGVNIIIPTAMVQNTAGRSLLGHQHDERNAILIGQAEVAMTGALIRQLRPYVVSTFLPKNHNLPLLPLRLRDGEELPGWFLLTDPKAYDPVVGLLTHAYQGEYIV